MSQYIPGRLLVRTCYIVDGVLYLIESQCMPGREIALTLPMWDCEFVVDRLNACPAGGSR